MPNKTISLLITKPPFLKRGDKFRMDCAEYIVTSVKPEEFLPLKRVTQRKGLQFGNPLMGQRVKARKANAHT